MNKLKSLLFLCKEDCTIPKGKIKLFIERGSPALIDFSRTTAIFKTTENSRHISHDDILAETPD